MYGPLDGPSGSARWHAGLPEAVGYQDNIADDVDGAAEVEVVADVAGRLGLAKVSCDHGNIADEVDVADVEGPSRPACSSVPGHWSVESGKPSLSLSGSGQPSLSLKAS